MKGSQTVVRDGEIHVWHGTLDLRSDPVSPAEEARAQRMRSARRRREFLICRGGLRRILSEVTGIERLAVPIREGAHGKPHLAGHGPSHVDLPPLRFSLTHSGERFIIALALNMDPGVDVERIRPRRDLARLMRRFFSQSERDAVAEAPDPLLAFYRVWTRKEAIIKADGRGVSLGLDRFDVSAGEPPVLLDARWEGAAAGEAAQWSLHPLAAGAGHVAALAVRRPAASVVIRTAPTGGLRAGRPERAPSPTRR